MSVRAMVCHVVHISFNEETPGPLRDASLLHYLHYDDIILELRILLNSMTGTMHQHMLDFASPAYHSILFSHFVGDLKHLVDGWYI